MTATLLAAVPPFLSEVVVLILAAALVAYVCQRIGLVPIVGFLLAGVAIGPNALGLVEDRELIDAAAEVGVLLLLFTIGIEFSLDKLARIRRLIFVGGGLQVLLVTAVVAGIAVAFGVDWRVGVFTGFLAALSSTAIVTKLLGDRGETNAPHGQAAVGLLIFQDLAIIVMVLLVPALGGGGGEAGGMDMAGLAWALTKAALIIAFVLVVARRLLPPLLEHVARVCSPELFLLTVIAVCFGTAFLVGLAGVSVALGAFLAGLVVSQSRFAEHALSEILPLQILFSATFFVSVGLLLDLGFAARHLPLVLAAIAAVLLVKLATTFVAVRAVGRSAPVAMASALWLAQVGEFSFVLERAGRDVGLTPMGLGEDGSQAFIAATVFLMALTPVFAPLAGRLVAQVQRLRARVARRPMAPATATEDDTHAVEAEALEGLRNHVIVAGFGRAARRLTNVLEGSRIPFAVLTLSPEGAREAEAQGLPTLRGDYTKRYILEAAGLERAKMLIIPDDAAAQAHRVLSVARPLAPTTRIVACVRDAHDAEELRAAGADRVIAAELEAVVGLFDDVLRNYQVDPPQILRHEEAIRRGTYDALDETMMTEAAVACELDDECFSTRTFTVRADTPAAGHRLEELQLDERLLHVTRVDHVGELTVEPHGDTVLEVGDVVTVAGEPERFAEAAALFRVHESPDDNAIPPVPPLSSRQRADYVDTEATVTLEIKPGATCTHLDAVRPVQPRTAGCEECLRDGTSWVHLRVCMTCGHVGCCDSSPGKHASAHYHETGHPIARSLEPGETWGWCYEDEEML